MSLSQQQIDELLNMLALTRPEESTCDECGEQLAEFAENQLAGRSVPEALQAIEHHLALCSDCCELFESLMAALEE
ncbi:MAG: Mut7-C RNAse domain-containing protein [Aeoliella sp.]